MRRETLDDLAADVGSFAFDMLDSYFLAHEMSADDAGRMASDLEKVLRDMLDQHFNAEHSKLKDKK